MHVRLNRPLLVVLALTMAEGRIAGIDLVADPDERNQVALLILD